MPEYNVEKQQEELEKVFKLWRAIIGVMVICTLVCAGFAIYCTL